LTNSKLYERVEITACVTLPPSINHMYRPGSKPGARYKTDEAKAWELEAAWDFAKTVTPNLPARRLKAPLLFEAWFYFPDRRRTDADNRVKIVQDLVARAVGFDDSDIRDVVLHKRIDRDNPRCEVMLREMPESYEDGSGELARRVVGVEPQKGNWRDLMEEE
jgi:crossover junction endodeoxyribonuclease RusA